jgi:hypothetical protein
MIKTRLIMLWLEFYKNQAEREKGIVASRFAWAGEDPLAYLNSFKRSSKICIATSNDGLCQVFEQKRGKWALARP